MLEHINTKTIRYIKLGSNGSWANEAFNSDRILFGANGVSHDDCKAENWETVTQQLMLIVNSSQDITNGLRQLKAIYSKIPTLWITMANGHLWWCQSMGVVHSLNYKTENDPSRYIETTNGWSKTNLNGEPLLLGKISSSQ